MKDDPTVEKVEILCAVPILEELLGDGWPFCGVLRIDRQPDGQYVMIFRESTQ